jgi:hypothetical protein
MAGFFADKDGNSLPVPDGVRIDIVDMNTTTLELEPGFWRTSSTSTDVRHCPSPDACMGGSDTSGYCAEGHTGAYCDVCVDGYSEVGTSLTGMTCVECTGGNKATVALGAVVLAALLIASCVYFWLKRRKSEDVLETTMGDAKAALATKKQLEKKRKAARAFLNHVQTPFKILLSCVRELNNELNAPPTDSFSRTLHLRRYAQIVSGFSFNFGIRFPKLFSSVMAAMSFANLDFISVTPMGCLVSTSYHHQLLTYTILPLVAFAALLGLYVNSTPGVRERSERKQRASGSGAPTTDANNRASKTGGKRARRRQHPPPARASEKPPSLGRSGSRVPAAFL